MNADTSLGRIRKDRYCLTYNNQSFQIDVYPFWKDRAIAEIELQHVDDQIDFPESFRVIKEVTGDPEYRNASLARRRPE
jgi:CYTH domain-containing protein